LGTKRPAAANCGFGFCERNLRASYCWPSVRPPGSRYWSSTMTARRLARPRRWSCRRSPEASAAAAGPLKRGREISFFLSFFIYFSFIAAAGRVATARTGRRRPAASRDALARRRLRPRPPTHRAAPSMRFRSRRNQTYAPCGFRLRHHLAVTGASECGAGAAPWHVRHAHFQSVARRQREHCGFGFFFVLLL